MMAAGIREEMRRLHRRKQLHFNPNESHLDRESSSDSPGSPSASGFAATYHHSHRDKPLFTFRQVSLIHPHNTKCFIKPLPLNHAAYSWRSPR